MSIFSKIGHGGVKVQVQAPSSIPSNQPIPVTVNITSEETKTIKDVKAEIKVEMKEVGVGFGGMNMGGMNNGGVGVDESRTSYQTVAVAENRDQFVINAGETKTLTFQLYLQGNNNANGNRANVGGVLGSLMNIANSLENVNYLYRVYAYVKVDGAAMDAKDEQAIQLLPPENANGQQPQTIANFAGDQNQPMPEQSQPQQQTMPPMPPVMPMQPPEGAAQPEQTPPNNNPNNPV
jgi:hypothetical protein